MDWNIKFILIDVVICFQIILVISSGEDSTQSTSAEIKEFSTAELAKLLFDELIKQELPESGGFASMVDKENVSLFRKEMLEKQTVNELERNGVIIRICENNEISAGILSNDQKSCVNWLRELFPNFDLSVLEKLLEVVKHWYDITDVVDGPLLQYVITFPVKYGWDVNIYCGLLNGIHAVILKNSDRLNILKMISSRSFNDWERYFNRDVTQRFHSEIAIPKMMQQQSAIPYYDFYIQWYEMTANKYKTDNQVEQNFNDKFGCPSDVIEVLVKLFVSLSLPQEKVNEVYNLMCLNDFYLNWKEEVVEIVGENGEQKIYERYHSLNNFISFALTNKINCNIIKIVLTDGFNTIKAIYKENFTRDLTDDLVDMNEIKSIISDCQNSDEQCIKWGLACLFNFHRTYIGRKTINEIRTSFKNEIKLMYLIGKIIKVEIDDNLDFIYVHLFNRLLHLLRNNTYEYYEKLLNSINYSFSLENMDAFDLLLVLHLYKYDELTECIELQQQSKKFEYEEKLGTFKDLLTEDYESANSENAEKNEDAT